MSFVKTTLLAALASAVVTAGYLSFVHHRRAEEAAGLRRANSQMRFEASQRRDAQSFDPSPAIRNAGIQPESAGTASIPADTSSSPQAPGGDYRNEGNATPRATLQTFAWACDRGDAERVANLIWFDEGARRKIEAYMAALPENARARWASPEEMATELLTLANIKRPFPSARILEAATIEPISEGRVRLACPTRPRTRRSIRKPETAGNMRSPRRWSTPTLPTLPENRRLPAEPAVAINVARVS